MCTRVNIFEIASVPSGPTLLARMQNKNWYIFFAKNRDNIFMEVRTVNATHFI